MLQNVQKNYRSLSHFLDILPSFLFLSCRGKLQLLAGWQRNAWIKWKLNNVLQLCVSVWFYTLLPWEFHQPREPIWTNPSPELISVVLWTQTPSLACLASASVCQPLELKACVRAVISSVLTCAGRRAAERRNVQPLTAAITKHVGEKCAEGVTILPVPVRWPWVAAYNSWVKDPKTN